MLAIHREEFDFPYMYISDREIGTSNFRESSFLGAESKFDEKPSGI
jgi:hypothetical protein